MRHKLTNLELAKVALKLLQENGGFTIDEYGEPAKGEVAPWAVSVEGKERKFPPDHIPELFQIRWYLKDFLLTEGVYFGGWIDDDGVAYLDHTLLFNHKHSAVYEGLQRKQKAIYNLVTGETVSLVDVPQVPQCNHPQHCNPGLIDCPRCGARFDPEGR